MSGFYRMEVKVISKTGKRQNGAIGENSAQSASAYITASKIDTLSPIDASAYISGNKVETETRLADYTKKKGYYHPTLCCLRTHLIGFGIPLYCGVR